MQVKVYGDKAKQITEGQVFRAIIDSVEGKTVVTLESEEMGTIYFLDSISCIDNRDHHEWRVSSEFADTCIHCRNVKDIRDGKIYQWSEL